jgi:hypothetical protein
MQFTLIGLYQIEKQLQATSHKQIQLKSQRSKANMAPVTDN